MDVKRLAMVFYKTCPRLDKQTCRLEESAGNQWTRLEPASGMHRTGDRKK
jgi:hypothetical protein